jgi:hypothetical protein
MIKFITFGLTPPMNRLKQIRLSALLLLLSFIASSVITKVISKDTSSPETWADAVHSESASPVSDNGLLVFEETEKELEEKIDRDSDSEPTLNNHTCIGDFSLDFRVAEQTPYRSSLFARDPGTISNFSPSIFILDGALLL